MTATYRQIFFVQKKEGHALGGYHPAIVQLQWKLFKSSSISILIRAWSRRIELGNYFRIAQGEGIWHCNCHEISLTSGAVWWMWATIAHVPRVNCTRQRLLGEVGDDGHVMSNET